MNERHIYTPEEKALIEERIGHMGIFLQDVFDNPAITEVVPGDSELRFQEVAAGATTFHLIAFRPEGARDAPWVARVITPAEYAAEHRGVTGPENVPAAGGNPVTRPVVGDTAEQALDALAAKLVDAQPRLREVAAADRGAA